MIKSDCTLVETPAVVKRMAIRRDLTGLRFTRLLVLEQGDYHEKPSGQRCAVWKCRCDCGIIKNVTGASLVGGKIKSCGCFRVECGRNKQRTHGLSKTPLYAIWGGIVDRCENHNSPIFGHYGGRGIRVCQRWRDSFEAFLADMGPRPSTKYSVERKNNDGPYDPINCVWATKKVQMRNTRTNVFVECRGERRCVSDWAELTGLKPASLRYRLVSGWTPETAIFTPIRPMRLVARIPRPALPEA